jgi:dihydrofolate reductase
MHKVIVIQFVTLDGVVEDPDGSGGTPNGGWAFRHGPEAVTGDKFRLGGVLDTGVKLLGRTTWELFSRIFPHRDDDFSRRMNAIEKVVVSGSLDRVDGWANSTLLRGELAEEVTRRLDTQDVIVAGSSSVLEQLIAADLVDQYRLLVFPTLLGKGRRLFDGVSAPVELELVSSDAAGGGVVRQVYDRRRNGPDEGEFR